MKRLTIWGMVNVPAGWRVLPYNTIEKRGDKITYDDGKTWLASGLNRWNSPVSSIIPTIRRIAKKRRAKK